MTLRLRIAARLGIVAEVFLLAICVVCGFAADVPANEGSRSIKIGERFTLKSTILNEQRPYWVYLPASYHDKEFAPLR